MKRFVPIAVLLALVSLPALAQNVSVVQGSVVDFASRQPIPGVRVRAVSPSGSVEAVSNERGFYTLWNVPRGPVMVQFSHHAYLALSGKLCIEPSIKRRIDVRLDKEPGSRAYDHWLKSRANSALLRTSNATTLMNC